MNLILKLKLGREISIFDLGFSKIIKAEEKFVLRENTHYVLHVYMKQWR